MVWIKKLLKNRTMLLTVCVIVVSLVYRGVQKAIDNYNFKHNSDIVAEEISSATEKSEDFTSAKGKIPNEETDLVLEEIEDKATEDTNETDTDETEEIEEQRKIYVYVTGEVNVPGVVILNEGSRIADAINAAEGTTAKADISKVNLVYVLEDGMKVNIPNKSELKNNSNFEYITMNSGDGGKDDFTEPNDNSGNTSSSVNSNSNSKRYDIVNINTATQTELETLPGIGPSLALKIINHRKENGKFSSVEQIKEVSGIGESKFENLKSYISI